MCSDPYVCVCVCNICTDILSHTAGILAKKKRKITNAPTQSMISVRGALAWTVAILLRNEKVLV